MLYVAVSSMNSETAALGSGLLSRQVLVRSRRPQPPSCAIGDGVCHKVSVGSAARVLSVLAALTMGWK